MTKKKMSRRDLARKMQPAIREKSRKFFLEEERRAEDKFEYVSLWVQVLGSGF